MEFIVIIPARYGSSRLPGKPLKDICGTNMVTRVAKKALASGASRVIIATDSELVANGVQLDNVEICMTSAHHSSGTERLAEVCRLKNIADDAIIVNVQGDEPLIPPKLINQVADDLNKSNAPMATLCVPIVTYEELFNPNSVKVITNKHGNALYFSRSPMPYDRDNFKKLPMFSGNIYYRHLGIYAYRARFLQEFISWSPSSLENTEKLEQLRVLDNGKNIHVSVATTLPPPGVDTAEDLQNVINYVLKNPNA